MGEVGERGVEFHDEIGRYARERRIDRLFATGELCRAAVAAFGKGARHFADVETLATAAKEEVTAGTAALVKGSRFMRMERVVQVLAADPQRAGTH
jgi:UDP-N-acetylmuramoyl-tripeptide--D-alanyl-D-alanine ligase